MSYKKAGSLTSNRQSHSQPRRRFEYHVVVALVLMVLAVVARFVVPAILETDATSPTAMSYLGAWVAAKLTWVWASIHLALHYRLSAAWGLWGLLFLVGTAVIVWAGTQKPKWDMARARRPKNTGSHKGDPDSLY